MNSTGFVGSHAACAAGAASMAADARTVAAATGIRVLKFASFTRCLLYRLARVICPLMTFIARPQRMLQPTGP
jgi:hypothetical protein